MSEYQELIAPLPLSAEDAYWHACTGTPYEPTFVAIRIDSTCPRDRIYFMPEFIMSAKPFKEWPPDWAKHCGVIYNSEQLP